LNLGGQEIEPPKASTAFSDPIPTTEGEQTARLARNNNNSQGQIKLGGAGELRVGVCECVADTAGQTLHRGNGSQRN
jgi:hypothetical protein